MSLAARVVARAQADDAAGAVVLRDRPAAIPRLVLVMAADAQQAELFEQIGRLKMELEWVRNKAAAFL